MGEKSFDLIENEALSRELIYETNIIALKNAMTMAGLEPCEPINSLEYHRKKCFYDFDVQPAYLCDYQKDLIKQAESNGMTVSYKDMGPDAPPQICRIWIGQLKQDYEPPISEICESTTAFAKIKEKEAQRSAEQERLRLLAEEEAIKGQGKAYLDALRRGKSQAELAKLLDTPEGRLAHSFMPPILKSFNKPSDSEPPL